MKKALIILTAIVLSFNNFALSSPIQKEKETLQEIQNLEKLFQCVSEQHSKYYQSMSSLYDEYAKRNEMINNNPKFFNKFKKHNQQGKDAVIDNEYFLAETFLNLRLQYLAAIASCLSKSKGLPLDQTVDENLNKQGFKNQKGTI